MARTEAERKRMRKVFTTDPEGIPEDMCELALLVDGDGDLHFAWFDMYGFSGGNRRMSKDMVRRMARALNDWLEGSL